MGTNLMVNCKKKSAFDLIIIQRDVNFNEHVGVDLIRFFRGGNLMSLSFKIDIVMTFHVLAIPFSLVTSIDFCHTL